MKLKKILRSPAFALITPIVLALAILLALRYFGGQYRKVPFIYTAF